MPKEKADIIKIITYIRRKKIQDFNNIKKKKKKKM